MELKQQLADVKKEAIDNEKALQHWQHEHDKLKLTDIEYVAPYQCYVMQIK
jgi:structural maintenance of chromosome 4